MCYKQRALGSGREICREYSIHIMNSREVGSGRFSDKSEKGLGKALRFAGWRHPWELVAMGYHDKRNTLIVELAKITSQSGGWLQESDDYRLIESAFVAVYLRDAGIRSKANLNTMSVEDQRNTLIVEMHMRFNEKIADLQGMSNFELVDFVARRDSECNSIYKKTPLCDNPEPF